MTTRPLMSRKARDRELAVELGKQLRLARKLRGLTLAQLAALCGERMQTLQKWETGDNQITATTLLRLAVALDVPVARLFVVARHAAEAAR